jgi:undecaprenyl-diphosphatase
MIFIPLSRVYLGQHYLSDVIVGVALSFALAHYTFILIDKMKDDEHIYTVMLIPFMILALFFIQNEIMFVAAGGFTGFAIGYYLEKRFVKYEVFEKNYIQVLKIIFGIAIVFAIRIGLKAILPYSANHELDPNILDFIFDFIRYFFIVAWAAVGAPFVFKHAIKHR